MKFAKDFYLSEKLSPNRKELCFRLKMGKMKRMVYVIYLTKYSNTPEIMSSIFFKQKYFNKYPVYVLGLTENYDQAIHYVANLLEQSYLEKGNFNIKENYKRC